MNGLAKKPSEIVTTTEVLLNRRVLIIQTMRQSEIFIVAGKSHNKIANSYILRFGSEIFDGRGPTTSAAAAHNQRGLDVWTDGWP